VGALEQMNVGEVFRVNYGYRALLDWSKAGIGERPSQAEDGLTGPFHWDNKWAAPAERQGSSGTKVPGAFGMFFDTIAGSKGTASRRRGSTPKPSLGGTKEDKVDSLGSFPQQWLYLAAESMRYEALGRTGLRETVEEDGRRAVQYTEDKRDPKVDRRNRTYGEEYYKGAGHKKAIAESNVFQKLFKGLGSSGQSWLAAYSDNVAKRGPDAIKKLQQKFERWLSTKSVFRNIESVKKGLPKGAALITDSDPQTVEEFAATSGGKATAPQEIGGYDFQLRSPKPIDLKFNDWMTLDRGPRIKRMDITSTFLIDPQTGYTTGTHGTGKVKYKFEGVKKKIDVEKEIERAQKQQIDSMNTLMRAIVAWAEELGLETRTGQHVDFQKISDQLAPASARKGGFGGTEWKEEGNQRSLDMILQTAAAAGIGGINEIIQEGMQDTIIAILHHMANMMPGQGEDYANTMSIMINGQWSTLVLIYDVTSEGYYDAVYANIFEDQSPLEWIITQGHDLVSDAALETVANNANAGVAGLGLSGIHHYGALAQGAELAAGLGVHPRITMGKLIPAQFSQQLNLVMIAVFQQLTKDMKNQVNKEIKMTAVRFSKWTRTDAFQGSHIRDWYNYASELLRGTKRGQAVTDEADPFWYLWAAPYISGEFHAEGFGKQYKGGVHSSMGAKHIGQTPSGMTGNIAY